MKNTIKIDTSMNELKLMEMARNYADNAYKRTSPADDVSEEAKREKGVSYYSFMVGYKAALGIHIGEDLTE